MRVRKRWGLKTSFVIRINSKTLLKEGKEIYVRNGRLILYNWVRT